MQCGLVNFEIEHQRSRPKTLFTTRQNSSVLMSHATFTLISLSTARRRSVEASLLTSYISPTYTTRMTGIFLSHYLIVTVNMSLNDKSPYEIVTIQKFSKKQNFSACFSGKAP